MIPEWTFDKLPVIQYPFDNRQEVTKNYLGNRAISGQEYANINVFMENNAQAEALYKFWRDDCVFGTKQFLVPLPYNGVHYSRDIPNVLCEFIKELSAEKINNFWNEKIELKVIEYNYVLGNIVDDSSNQLVDDAGNILVSTSSYISNSSKEI